MWCTQSVYTFDMYGNEVKIQRERPDGGWWRLTYNGDELTGELCETFEAAEKCAQEWCAKHKRGRLTRQEDIEKLRELSETPPRIEDVLSPEEIAAIFRKPS